MRGIGPEQLRRLAPEAIEEAVAASHSGPVPRTRGLALALAWLLHFGKEGETLLRWPSESFWKGLSNEREHDRWPAVNAAANAIYLVVGGRCSVNSNSRSSERRSCKHKLDAKVVAGPAGTGTIGPATRLSDTRER